MLDFRPTTADAMPRHASDSAPSPLMLCDRLISLAQEAGRSGHRATATQLIRLAHTVLDEGAVPHIT